MRGDVARSTDDIESLRGYGQRLPHSSLCKVATSLQGPMLLSLGFVISICRSIQAFV